MRTFTCTEGGSSKFWNIELKGNTFTAFWGKIGTAGQSKTQTFADEEKARKEHDKLVNEKLKKGYVETTAGGASRPAAAPPAPTPAPAPAKKKQPAQATPPEPAPAPPPPPVAAVPTLRTFAYSDASSHKFWNIEFQGTGFTVTYGRQGTAGQTQVKSFPDEAKARKEHDKLITEKTNKGYKETTPVKAQPGNLRESLELALVENPDDLANHMAYADWLSEQPDKAMQKRAEFIRVQLALEDESLAPAQRKALQQQEKALLKANARVWLGGLAPFVFERPADVDEYSWPKIEYQFRRGWLDNLKIALIPTSLSRALASDPQARLLRRLEIQTLAYDDAPGNEPDEDTPEDIHRPQLCPLIKATTLGNVRVFILGATMSEEHDRRGDEAMFECHLDGQAAVGIIKQMPKVEELYLLAHRVDGDQLFGMKTLHHLRVLQLYHCHSYPLTKLAKNTSLGKLTHLLLHPHALEYDAEAYIQLAGIKALVNSPNVPALTHLRLRLTNAGDKGVKEIVASGILKRLKMLDLCHGAITEKGAQLLADCPDLKNLELLDVTNNVIGPAGIDALKKTGVNFLAERQRSASEPDAFDEEVYLGAGDVE